MNIEKRQFWIKTLSCSDIEDIENLWEKAGIEKPSFQYIRKPETGVYMIRGRMDGDGEKFNLGEVLVSRCALKVEDRYLGVSYVRGTNKEHCEFSALIDAMLQNEDHFSKIWNEIIVPASEILEQRVNKEALDVDKTRVEFFTMG